MVVAPHPPLDVGSGLEALVTVAYPVTGLAVVGAMVATRLFPARNGTLAMRLVAAGAGVSVVANALYSQAGLTGGFVSGGWLELAWQAQGVVFAVAAYVAIRGIGCPGDWMRFRDDRGVETGVVLTTATGVALFVALAGGGELSLDVLAAVVLLLALASVRLWLLVVSRGGPTSFTDAYGLYDRAYLEDQSRGSAPGARTSGSPSRSSRSASTRAR